MTPWLCFSSSSGETFRAVYRALSNEEQKSLRGFFVDRPCGAVEIAKQELPMDEVHEFGRKDFEARALEWMQEKKFKGHILLCGFFGILSADFLAKCPGAVVNTHPSLLPSFPGKDEKVHKLAFQTAALSGFTVHLVNEALDGGPILFQHPVHLDVTISQEENRARVRAAEQLWLPRVWSGLLRVPLEPADRNLGTSALRVKRGINFRSFKDMESLG